MEGNAGEDIRWSVLCATVAPVLLAKIHLSEHVGIHSVMVCPEPEQDHVVCSLLAVVAVKLIEAGVIVGATGVRVSKWSIHLHRRSVCLPVPADLPLLPACQLPHFHELHHAQVSNGVSLQPGSSYLT